MARNPRPEKVAVVDDVRERLDATSATILAEYRGLSVAKMAELRTSLRDAGGEFKVYKNTLVRFAARDLGLDIEDLLTGPTALAFVVDKPDGSAGDAVDVAKVLKDFGKDNPALVVKGGVLGDKLLSADDAKALADVEPREVLLAKLAGGMAAPMVQFAGLLQALPRNMAYGLKALIDQGGAAGAPADETRAGRSRPRDRRRVHRGRAGRRSSRRRRGARCRGRTDHRYRDPRNRNRRCCGDPRRVRRH